MHIKDKSFKGQPYKHSYDPANHSSWWEFDDEDEVRQRWWDIKKGDVVADVGAAFGSYTLTALALGASKVLAWVPEAFGPPLAENLELNGWKDKVVAFDSGLWSSAGFVQAQAHEPMPIFAQKLPEAWKGLSNAFPVTTFDAAVAKLGLKRLDWFKIDTEGAEIEVLKGAEDSVVEFQPNILVENHLFKGAHLYPQFREALLRINPLYVEVGTVPYHGVSHSFYQSSNKR
jgi:FkbM family methyltransferase